MLLVEDVRLNPADGTRDDSASSFPPSSPSSSSYNNNNGGINRESDLKKIFVSFLRRNNEMNNYSIFACLGDDFFFDDLCDLLSLGHLLRLLFLSLSRFVMGGAAAAVVVDVFCCCCETKTKKARLHELYVQHTMNPFSQLRSPIRSRRFDDGIVEMARSYNDAALERVTSSLEGEYGGGGMAKKDGLAWM